MNKKIEVFTKRYTQIRVGDRQPDWSVTGPNVAFKVDPNIQCFVIEDKDAGKLFMFPLANVECITIADASRMVQVPS